jgi:DNA-binding IclR family transcriptional regulator
MRRSPRVLSPSVRELPVEKSVDGAQSLERGLRILRDIASSGAIGRRLVDIQQSTGLSKSTAHRLAQTLVYHSFASYDRHSRRYFLGTEVSILSVSAPSEMAELRELSRDDLRAVARLTGDTAYLTVRSGNDAVYVARELGSYPIKALTGEIGTRRPLGVGAAGVALLASLDDDEIERVRRSNKGRLRRFPNATEKAIATAVAATRRDGFAYSRGLVIDAVRGVGVEIRDAQSRVIAALSVAAIRERMTTEHRSSVVTVLARAKASLERRLSRRGFT